MMMEAAPETAVEMAQPELLLEFEEVALDSPAQLGQPDQFLKRDEGGKVAQPILGRFGAPFGPLDDQPLFAVGNGTPIIAMGGTHAKRERGTPLVP